MYRVRVERSVRVVSYVGSGPAANRRAVTCACVSRDSPRSENLAILPLREPPQHHRTITRRHRTLPAAVQGRLHKNDEAVMMR